MKKLMTLAAVMAAIAMHAALTPATLFSDHCVLQRGKKVPVWGKADPGAAVTVEFAGQKKQAKADGAGCWRVDLDPLEVSCDPREMRIAADGAAHEEVVLKDVLVGVVWLCGGQSNMTFAMWPEPRIGTHAGREMNGYYDIMLTDAPLVRGGLEEGRNVAGEGLAEVVDQAHADDLVHVRLGKGVAQEKRHEREPPAVVGHALAPPAGRVAMPRGVLEALSDVENI